MVEQGSGKSMLDSDSDTEQCEIIESESFRGEFIIPDLFTSHHNSLHWHICVCYREMHRCNSPLHPSYQTELLNWTKQSVYWCTVIKIITLAILMSSLWSIDFGLHPDDGCSPKSMCHFWVFSKILNFLQAHCVYLRSLPFLSDARLVSVSWWYSSGTSQ